MNNLNGTATRRNGWPSFFKMYARLSWSCCGGELGDERGVLRRGEAVHESAENGGFVETKKSGRIKPKSGK